MNEEFKKIVTEAYSKILTPIDTSKPYAVSFEGSQKPFEFFSAWEVIDEKLDKNINPTFLEIGAFKGLWAIAFFEWCKMNNLKGEYMTVTWMEHNSANADLNKVLNHYKNEGFEFSLIDKNSQLEETKNDVVKYNPRAPIGDTTFDIILIDADHRYEGAKKDIELYSPLTGKLLLFHDIRPYEPTNGCGVYKAIVDSNIKLDHEIASSGDMMGIGIKFY